MAIRKRILRVHGTILVLLGLGLTTNATIGTFRGIGVFHFLQENHLAMVGLSQAYLLMAIIGAVLWLGSVEQNVRKWHAIGAVAHAPPLAMLITFWNLFGELNMVSVAVIAAIIHSVFLCVESTALLYRVSRDSAQ